MVALRRSSYRPLVSFWEPVAPGDREEVGGCITAQSAGGTEGCKRAVEVDQSDCSVTCTYCVIFMLPGKYFSYL